MKPVALYVTVSDMKESLAFYSHVFQCTPAHIEERYSYFDIDGFSFGIFSADFEDKNVVYGNNSVLCFQVSDINAEYARLKQIVPRIDEHLLELPSVILFQFTDLDGNLIEVFKEK